MNNKVSTHRWQRSIVATMLCLLAITLVVQAKSQQRKPRKAEDNRVYLLHADELKYDVYGPNPEAQIAKGRVSFLHRGSHLTCDSAYFYQTSNSVKAFGHVHFRQGDTLSLTCEYANYDGQAQMLQARRNVVLKHRGQTLNTDSLNYDRLYSTAYFFKGGRLTDRNSKLSADWGKYNTTDKQAVFYYNVQLVTPKNRVSTDTLYYDTKTKRAHVVGMYTPNQGRGKTGPSIITGKDGKIHTKDAYFNTATDQAELFGRSTIDNNEKTITGDTLYYDSATGNNRGRGRVIYVDKKHQNELHCGHVVYNEKTGRGWATQNALVKDYSQGDTLYMHADTLRIETFHINTDSVFRKVHAYFKVKIYRKDIQAVCDSAVLNSKDSCLIMYHDPVAWNANRQLFGEIIKAYFKDSTIREAQVLGQAFSTEQMPDSVHFNQISSKQMYAYFTDGVLRRTDAIGNVLSVYYPMDDKDSTLIGLNYLETDTMRMYLTPERQLESIRTPRAQGTIYPMSQIPADKKTLPNFQWFDYMRPLSPEDVFEWRGKNKGTQLKNVQRSEAPLQKLNRAGDHKTETPPAPTHQPNTKKNQIQRRKT